MVLLTWCLVILVIFHTNPEKRSNKRFFFNVLVFFIFISDSYLSHCPVVRFKNVPNLKFCQKLKFITFLQILCYEHEVFIQLNTIQGTNWFNETAKDGETN